MTAGEELHDAHGVSTNVALRAIFSVLAAQREQSLPEGGLRTELLLADAGIDYKDIAVLLGRKPDAVRMLISRARKQAGAASGRASSSRAAKRA